MKKLFALLLAVVMVMSMATMVSAETTTLTTEVPAASYTLNVPIECEVPFGAIETDIGSITVTGASGFAEGKNLKVTLNYSDFESESVSTTIPFQIMMINSNEYDEYKWSASAKKVVPSGGAITFSGETDGTVHQYFMVEDIDKELFDMDMTLIQVTSADWGKALAGEYTATITYTAEVVVEE